MQSTMETAALRAEIKSWERAFRADNHRDPSINDIKTNPDIAAKYKLYKKLSKDLPRFAAQKPLSSGESSTPHRSSLSPGPSSLVRKSRATYASADPTTVNPFSPTKARINSGIPNHTSLDRRPQVVGLLTTPPSRKRICSTPSPESLPATRPSLPAAFILDSTPVDNSAIRKARKRLRGDPVSPSPSRSGKKQRVSARFGPDLQPTLSKDRYIGLEDNEVDMSYVDESPVKPISNGKDFKLLFDEGRVPKLDLTGSNRRSFDFDASRGCLRDGDELLEPVSDKRANSQKQGKALHSLKTTGGAKGNPWISTAVGKKPCNVVDDVSRNIFLDIGEGLDRTDQKKLSSEDTSGLPSDTPVFAIGLLPPSPPPSTTGIVQGVGTAGANRIRKKQKLLMDTNIDDDSLEEQSDIHVVEFDSRSLRKLNAHAVNNDEVDEAERNVLANYRDEDDSRTGEIAPLGTEFEVDLPEDLRKILYISSSYALDRDREERALVDSLLHGASDSRNQRGEVWGAGEVEDAASDIPDCEDDWAGEGVPWEVGEL